MLGISRFTLEFPVYCSECIECSYSKWTTITAIMNFLSPARLSVCC